MLKMVEDFCPIPNVPPVTFISTVLFYMRRLMDFSFTTTYRDIKNTIPFFKGSVLDVGCGQSPFKHLLDPAQTAYFGIDVIQAAEFGYNNPEIIIFNGEDIPFEDEKFDALICAEVLEHVGHYTKLIGEMRRVMKKGAVGIITVPWSARYHYIPYDFFRYTPSSLEKMFGIFDKAEIEPRGSDITVIAAKIVLLWFRNLIPSRPWKWVFVPIWATFLPLIIIVVLLGHLSLWLKLGSVNDPLGYTIIVKR